MPVGQRPRSRGGGRARVPQYLENYKDLGGKNVLCPPPPLNIEPLTVLPRSHPPPKSQSSSAVPVGGGEGKGGMGRGGEGEGNVGHISLPL